MCFIPKYISPEEIIKELVSKQEEKRSCNDQPEHQQKILEEIKELQDDLINLFYASPKRLQEFKTIRQKYDTNHLLEEIFCSLDEDFEYLKKENAYLREDDEVGESTVQNENFVNDNSAETEQQGQDAVHSSNLADDANRPSEKVNTSFDKPSKVSGAGKISVSCCGNLTIPEEAYSVIWRYSRISKQSVPNLLRHALLEVEFPQADAYCSSMRVKGRNVKIFFTPEQFEKINKEAFRTLRTTKKILQELLKSYLQSSEFKKMRRMVNSYMDRYDKAEE